MRTQDEIVAYYHATRREDIFGFTADVLAEYLDEAHLRPLLSGNVTDDALADADWHFTSLTLPSVLEDMRRYMEFAWEKALNHRGLSAGRSIEKMRAWLWILEDEALLALSGGSSGTDFAPYQNYGAPILRAICLKYDFPMPETREALRMSEGIPCREGCTEGCGR